jgi:alkanesulfonate monooxygenase SsuD/methylene tetrahydromethanopterin reductase-like flavin-dependent oxidoreductase (luciferase family)
MVTVALRYDLRSPEGAPTKHPELYRTCLDQCAWADEHGVGDVVVLSEHHAMEDGFLPAPFTMAAAVAARTKRMMISIAAALIPLHDPIRLAEQIAVVDLISGGRVNFVAGAGYAQHEFEMAGIERRQRGKLLEEYVEVMLQAWKGGPFDWHGRTVQATPVPQTKPHPLIFMGGSSEAAARRAARLKLPFFPALGDERLVEWYRDEAAKVGFEQPFCLLPHGPGFVHVTEDPDEAWSRIAEYAWYDAETYRSWQAPGQSSEVTTHASNPDELRKEGIYRVVTPEECVALAGELGPTGTIVLHPLMGGMPAELGWSSLQLFREKVLPRLRPA